MHLFKNVPRITVVLARVAPGGTFKLQMRRVPSFESGSPSSRCPILSRH